MKKLFKWLKDKVHRHNYYKIIASQYVSFNYRNVVVECDCGKRKLEKRHHDDVYPFLTNILITNNEMKKLTNR